MKMVNHLEKLRELSTEMLAKDWSGAFLANGAYPDNFESCLGKYLEQSDLGTSGSPADRIVMTTYALWVDEHSDHVVCHFALQADQQGSLQFAGVEIVRNNRYGQALEQSCMIVKAPWQLPSRKQAIAAVNVSRQKTGQGKDLRARGRSI